LVVVVVADAAGGVVVAGLVAAVAGLEAPPRLGAGGDDALSDLCFFGEDEVLAGAGLLLAPLSPSAPVEVLAGDFGFLTGDFPGVAFAGEEAAGDGASVAVCLFFVAAVPDEPPFLAASSPIEGRRCAPSPRAASPEAGGAAASPRGASPCSASTRCTAQPPDVSPS